MLPTLLLLTLTLTPTHHKLQHLPDEETLVRESLTECVINAARRFFDPDSTIFYSLPLTEVTSDHQSGTVLDRLVLSGLMRDCQWPLLVRNVSQDYQQKHYQKPRQYIIQMRNQKEFFEDINLVKSHTDWNPHAKFLIITPKIFDSPREVATTLVKKLWRVHAVNGVVVLPTRKNTTVFSAFTWFPYKNGNCGDDFYRVVKIDSCSFGVFEGSVHWYPDKIPERFNGCTVKTRMVKWPPFVIQVPNGTWSNSTSSKNMGLEVNLLNLVAEVANLTFVYYYSQDFLNWGDVYDNGTISGNLRYLYNETDDVAIGAYAKTMLRSIFFEDIVYHYDSLIFCVPFSNQNTKLETVFKIIGHRVLLLTFIVYVTVTTLMWLSSTNDSTYKNFGSGTMKSFSVLIGLPASTLPKSDKVRFFLAMLLLYSFCIITAYQTLLASAMATPSSKQKISTVQDIIESEMPIYATPTSSRFFGTDGTNPSTNEINTAILKKWKNCNDTHQCLEEVAIKRRATVCFNHLFTEYIENSFRTPKNDPLLYCFDKTVVSFPLNILMRKGFQLYARFDALISRIVGAGFVDKWERDILTTRFENFTSSVEEESGGSNLDFDSLKPTFAIFGIGCGVAVIVFAFEVVFDKWINK